jgi:hypothetical protein
MSNLLKNNAYHILGLDTSVAQRDIQKRAKEIIKILQIDDVPEYDLDLGVFKNFRTEDAVKDAVQKLTSPKKQIQDYFFWFHVVDEVDEQAVDILRKKKPDGAIKAWKLHEEGNSTKAMFYKKNLALLYCILLFKEDNKQYLRESLQIWHELLNSSKFWTAFTKVYKHNDELNTDQKIISDFHKHAPSLLADLYTEISNTREDSSYIAEFTEVFSLRGEKMEKLVMAPIFHEITETVEQLEAMKVSEDGILDAEESATIKNHIGKIQDCCNKLIDLGLYDDSQSKTMRDRAANALKTIVLDLHNNLSETDKAVALLNIALKFVGTSSLESKIKQDIKTLEEVKRNTDLVKPVLDLISDEQYEKALDIIKTDREKHKNNHELQEFYNNQTKLCVSAIAVQKYNKARDYFDNKQEELAKPLFVEAGQLVYENIDLFNFNKKAIDEILDEVKDNASKFNLRNIDQFDEYRNSFVNLAKEKFEGQFEETILIILIDSHLFGSLSDFMKKIRHKSSVVNTLNTIGWFTIWFYGIGLIFFIAGWIYKNQD